MNLRVGQRLGAAFALLVLLLAVMASVAWSGHARQGAQVAGFQEVTLPAVRLVHAVSQHVDEARGMEALHVMLESEAEMKALEAQVAAHRQRADDHLAAYAKLASDEADRADLAAVKASLAAYWAAQDRLFAISRTTPADPTAAARARAQLTGDSQTAFRRLTADLTTWWNHTEERANQAGSQSRSAAAAMGWGLGALALVALVVAVLAGWLITRSITGPLAQASRLAQAVADGDLTQRVSVHHRDELGQLLATLDRMAQGLARTVGAVRQGADGIATASTEIAQGNADLSARTESQASSLQQTAASMEQMSGTVKASAESARRADALAQAASAAARQGGDAVGQVVATMQHIQAASRQIADIVGTIDGIAFQTNILALNAAVEASRAGEQGRGFAVVASEVRTLAGRCADAAREIKRLIGGTVAQIDSGTQEVNQAGATITDVVAQVQQVGDLIGEISNASREQHSGVAQVNQAVSQLDHDTQRNAALVQQTAAAAEGLKQQAARLAATVAVFRT